LARPVNLLVLDEPTNHLDLASREVLMKAVMDFPGTVMIVSHDRYFLKNITTRVFRLHHHHLEIYDGSWDEYSRKMDSLLLSGRK
jgi:ATP-binding cassette subfamily F protein 3